MLIIFTHCAGRDEPEPGPAPAGPSEPSAAAATIESNRQTPADELFQGLASYAPTEIASIASTVSSHSHAFELLTCSCLGVVLAICLSNIIFASGQTQRKYIVLVLMLCKAVFLSRLFSALTSM